MNEERTDEENDFLDRFAIALAPQTLRYYRERAEVCGHDVSWEENAVTHAYNLAQWALRIRRIMREKKAQDGANK